MSAAWGPRGAASGLRAYLMMAALSLGIGLLIGVAVGGGPPLQPLSVLLSGAVGLTIFLLTDLQLRLTRRWRLRLGRAAHAVALTVIFAVAGAAAWATVAGVFSLASGRSLRGGLFFPVALTGGLAVVVGFAFYTYERLRAELSDKISRLKTAEFAERELELARSVQRRLLPPLKVDAGAYRLAARNRPALWVAGDFYDVFTLPDGRQAIAIGDVAGKGMATSLIMASVKAMLPLVAAGRGAGETLTALNERLIDDLGSREFVAVALVLYQPASGELELANAGLPDPYLLRPGSDPETLAVSGQRLPLGVRQDGSYTSVAGRLEPGERLLLVTDGLPEAQTGADEILGYEAFEALLPGRPDDPAALLERLFQRIAVETGDEASDDWTAVLLERVV